MSEGDKYIGKTAEQIEQEDADYDGGGYIGLERNRTRLTRHPSKADAELEALLEKARGIVMTPAQLAAQRRSWVIGELMLSDDKLTREEAIQRVDQALLRLGTAQDRWKGIHKLVEECGELCQVVGKLSAFPDGDHPDGGPPLTRRLEEELADVQAAIIYVREANGLTSRPARVEEKLSKFRSWGLTGV